MDVIIKLLERVTIAESVVVVELTVPLNTLPSLQLPR